MKRIKIDDIEKSNFYKMPKKIYELDNLKPVDRELYMLCLENWRLSVKNNWINENGEIFFYASQNKFAQQMKVDKKTIIAAFKKLINNDLLEAEKEKGEPNMYYLADLNDIVVEKFHQSENSTGVVEKTDSIKNNITRSNSKRINNKESSSSENKRKDYEIYKNQWNEIAKKYELQQIKNITQNRIGAIKKLLKDYSEEEILENMKKIANYDFLLGKGKDQWKMSFDNFLEEEKFTRLLEGGYYDKYSKNKSNNSKQDKSNTTAEENEYAF